ncbi:hypothetical protein FRB95_006375 [Tulasnella sp. JGI-2019a]|nr:hypothetical protein FRB93_001990 [Tulasnella sp. JGI-2019a]KAG9028514.1 hypothetical protein FRB95_006375 [Tulasnella sp. JGI-2019a]
MFHHNWTVFESVDLNGKWVAVATAGLGTVVAVNLLGKLLRRSVLVPTLTIMDDLPNVGKGRKDGKLKGRAVVCGGSVAGLMAAAVCAEHFESVLVIEAEGSANETIDIPKETEIRIMNNGLPTRISSRKRVMQYSAIHVNQPPVQLGLERLFPAMQEELDDIGLATAPLAFSNFEYGGISCPEVYLPTDTDAPKILPVTREAFEILLRRLVVKYKSNVTFLAGIVDGFERDERDEHKLSGVKVRASVGKEVEPADFVIDATGPAQTSYHKWLANAGFGPLPDTMYEEYNPHCNYVQSTWTIPKHVMQKIVAVLPYGPHRGAVHYNAPDWAMGERRAQSIMLCENDQLQVMCGGWGISTADLPHTIQEYRAYTQSIHQTNPAPQWLYKMFDVLEVHEEECAPWYDDVNNGTFSFVKYHEADKGSIPSNWVSVGDSLMKLNPIYGQGCSKAMMDAVAINSLLRQVSHQQDLPPDFAASYFQKATNRTKGMWDSNKATDYGWDSTEPAKGETLAVGTFGRNFAKHITYVCRKNPKLFAMWLQVVNCLAPSTDFFTPSLLVRVAWSWLTN